MNEQTEEILEKLSETEEKELQSTIIEFIDKNLRPSLVMDGGDIIVHNFSLLKTNKYELVVELVGACSSCPSATMTMRMGVERMLLQNFPRIEYITPVNLYM